MCVAEADQAATTIAAVAGVPQVSQGVLFVGGAAAAAVQGIVAIRHQ